MKVNSSHSHAVNAVSGASRGTGPQLGPPPPPPPPRSGEAAAVAGSQPVTATFPRKRRKYDQEFKDEAVRRVLAGQSMEQVARDLGVSGGMVFAWRDQFFANQVPDSQGAGKDAFAHVTRDNLAEVLTKENARLRDKLIVAERQADILKKALGIVSKD